MIYHLKRAVNISKGMDALERFEQFDTFVKSHGITRFDLSGIIILIFFVIWFIFALYIICSE